MSKHYGDMGEEKLTFNRKNPQAETKLDSQGLKYKINLKICPETGLFFLVSRT